MKEQVIVRAGINWKPVWYALPFVLALLFWPGVFPIDDAYITLSNARVFISGQPDANYGTSYLTGATSPIHLLLVALAGLVMDPVKALMLIGVGGAVLYFVALQRLVVAACLAGWRRIAILWIGMVWGYAVFHYLNGLETSLAMALTAWMLVLAEDRRKLPILAGLAPFLRPELAVLGGLFMIRLGWQLRSTPKQLGTVFLVAGLVALPWAVWVWAETGHVFPSTMSAKLAFFREWILFLPRKLEMSAGALYYSLQLPLYVGLVGLRRAQWPALLFVAIYVAACVYLMPNALNWNEGRYASVLTPVLVMGLANLAAERSKASNVLLSVLTAASFFTLYMGIAEYSREIAYAWRVRDHAKFVATLPASSVVLVHDAGWVEWEKPKAKLVDLVGLKTLGIEPIHTKYSEHQCAWSKSFDVIARKYHATHVVVLNRWTWPCVADNFRERGWKLNPVYSDLYTVYEMSR